MANKQWVGAVMLATIVGFGATGAANAQMDGYGPDAWRVTGVASNDSLNARMGPGTAYPVIGTFAFNARGLQQITCVPFASFDQMMALTEAERDSLPPRWCLMADQARQTQGWVNASFLAEDN